MRVFMQFISSRACHIVWYIMGWEHDVSIGLSCSMIN